MKQKLKQGVAWASLFCWISLWAHGDEPANQTELKIYTLDYAPYQYEENGQLKGLGIELVSEAFRRAQRPVQIQIRPWARAIAEIKSGQTDALFTAYLTEERQQFADYISEVLIEQQVVFIVAGDSSIHFNGDFSSVSQYRMGLVRKFSYGKRFDDALKNDLFSQISYASDVTQNIKKFVQGRFDILVSDKLVAINTLKSVYGSLPYSILEPAVQSVPSYIMFSKARKLTKVRDDFDEALRSMKQDGSYKAIMKKYLK